ncbi:MAG: tRNA uridine-5-carboxymethylaminomethyl(34) synthesis GTPase MnmE [Elusimicrobia bacterium]|nr:tRNA uridine-5-carboxymethylaminomethyl(34) synthesis GTPase MnmE [Elusimicrobiota bacterium]
MDDTIAAVATPLGSGGLGVVRLSGPKALSIASHLFHGSFPLEQCPTHTLHHGLLKDQDDVLDEAVAGLFRAPRSYTGEDVVEFSCHGGAHVMRRVLDSCLRKGARLADPGEFTRRAFLNGKLDLTQAEAVGDLIAARSDAQRRLALQSLRGALSHQLRPFRERLLNLLAHIEAHLDFVEDEVPDLSRADIRKGIESLEADLATLTGAPGRDRLWREGIKIAIVGRPNAGKSSLFNALLNENRAIVADVPGTTRDTLEESAVWEGVAVTLVDTAGLRQTEDQIEREGAHRAREALTEADLVFLVVDAGAGPRAEDSAVAETVRRRPVILVLNKMDLISTEVRRTLENRWKTEGGCSDTSTVMVSARTGEGLDDLRWTALRQAGGGQEPQEPVQVFNARQEQKLRETLAALGRARAGAGSNVPEENLAVDMRMALEGLNAVTGQGAPEEVLDAIFARFCVGK